MRVINNGDGVRPRVLEMLHTSGDAYRLHLTQRVLGLCGTEIETGRTGDRDGRRRVRIVEIAVQCQAQLADRGAVDDDGEAAVIVIRRRGHDVCRGIAAKRERGDGNAGMTCVLPDEVGARAIGTQYEGTAVLDDLTLAVEIILERRMLDRADMVRADVEERGHVECETEHAVHLVGLRGDLHDEIFHAVINGLAHHAERIHGFRRGQIGFHVGVAVKTIVHGGKQRALAAGTAIEHRLREIGGGGLAFGAGDADHLQLVLRTTIEFSR